jgi:PIN domain nuclease of toxin-antitoxin system
MNVAERILLDTHVWTMLVDGARFAPRVLRKIERAASTGALYLAAISVWEIATLAGKGKLRLESPTLKWVTDAVHASRIVVYTLDPAISVDAAELRPFHGDPADRMIVATARHLGAVLVTRDSLILDYAGETDGVRVLQPT